MGNKVLQKKLLDWFGKYKRNLPFRNSKNPYNIWVSEVMLQQTRMEAMLPTYKKFIKQFPTIQTLAESSEEEVLRYWKGLGYYSRAKNLLKGAKLILETYSGNIPRTLMGLMKVPGIGDYTAKAILSIAYNLPYAVLDGNVKRILSRVYCIDGSIKDRKVIQILQSKSEELLNQEIPGDHNEAMMELGATICSQKPNCQICPINKNCLANLTNKIAFFPSSKKQIQKISITIVFILIWRNSKILLLKNSKRRFFKSIFSLPYYFENNDYYKNDPNIQKIIEKNTLTIFSKSFQHTITNHKIIVKLAEISQAKSIPLFDSEKTKYIHLSKLEDEFPSSIAKKICQKIIL